MARRQAAATSSGAIYVGRIVKDRRAPGGSRTHVAALRVRCPCHWTTSACPLVGPEGLEPSPGGLRVRCAAANTLIPSRIRKSAQKESNLRPDPYKRPALTVEPRAAFSRAGGTRTPGTMRSMVGRIKSPLCCHYTTTPCSVGRMRFKRTSANVSIFLSFRQVVALRVELSATRLSAGFGQPALGYHVLPVGMVGLEPTVSCAQGTRARRCPTSRSHQSERPDLNRRSPAPRAGAIARLRYVLVSVARAGVEPASPP